MYGLISQCLHDRKGRVIRCIPGEMGYMNSLDICLDNLDLFKIDDDTYYTVLADKSYQGLQEHVDVILPYKKKSGDELSREQKRHNKDLATEIGICGKYYETLKTRHRIMTTKYRNSREEYKEIFGLCIALTNYYVVLHPL